MDGQDWLDMRLDELRLRYLHGEDVVAELQARKQQLVRAPTSKAVMDEYNLVRRQLDDAEFRLKSLLEQIVDTQEAYRRLID